MIPFVSALNWSSSSVIEAIYYPYKYLATGVIFLCAIFMFLTGKIKIKKRISKSTNKNKIALLFVIYYFIYIINTILQTQDYLETTLKACIPEIAFIVLMILWFNYDIRKATRTISRLFIFYTLINLFLGIVAPGMFGTEKYDARNTYLLGERNALIYFLLPALIMVIVDHHINGTGRKTTWLMLVIVSITVIITGSSTALAVVLICFMLLVLTSSKVKWANRILAINIKAKTLGMLYVILWIMIILIQNVSVFSFFIEGILGRSLTFTNRTLIWDKALILISESPLFGYGGYFVQHIKIGGWTTYTCHNFFLQNMVDAGAVSIVVLVIIMILTIREMDQHRNNRLCKTLKIGIFSIFISCYMESYNMHYIIMLIMYLWYIKENRLLSDGKKCEVELRVE